MTPKQLASLGVRIDRAVEWAPDIDAAMSEFCINTPARQAAFIAQVLHESGMGRYLTEIWGPTPAQTRYEGRADLGNTQPGDGKRFMGRDLIQVTGRSNYRLLTAWVRKEFGSGPDFEAKPELLETDEWLGIGVIWYFLTRAGLLGYCRAGNIEMVTRRVNGGLNGYDDRLQWYDKTALAMLAFPSVVAFQKSAGLDADGISGPKTRAALHNALAGLGKPFVPIDAPDIGHTDGAVVQSGGLLARLITAIIGIIRGGA